MGSLINPKEFAKDFERTITMGKARAYSNLSLERSLTESEFNEYKRLMEIIKNG